MEVLNNCNELLEFVCNRLTNYQHKTVEFQGDTLEITTISIIFGEIGVIKGNTLISVTPSLEGFFELQAVESPICCQKPYPCVVVPDYVREELIATIKGEW